MTEGKIYRVVLEDSVWIFKYRHDDIIPKKTTHSGCVCILDYNSPCEYVSVHGVVCDDDDIKLIKEGSPNDIAIWYRIFIQNNIL